MCEYWICHTLLLTTTNNWMRCANRFTNIHSKITKQKIVKHNRPERRHAQMRERQNGEVVAGSWLIFALHDLLYFMKSFSPGSSSSVRFDSVSQVLRGRGWCTWIDELNFSISTLFDDKLQFGNFYRVARIAKSSRKLFHRTQHTRWPPKKLENRFLPAIEWETQTTECNLAWKQRHNWVCSVQCVLCQRFSVDAWMVSHVRFVSHWP